MCWSVALAILCAAVCLPRKRTQWDSVLFGMVALRRHGATDPPCAKAGGTPGEEWVLDAVWDPWNAMRGTGHNNAGHLLRSWCLCNGTCCTDILLCTRHKDGDTVGGPLVALLLPLF
uniref:Secreted protein n=1 Tax=Eutreptiella gymnastica TaxID=73025 RepID=A0A7S4CTK1_9EUGL